MRLGLVTLAIALLMGGTIAKAEEELVSGTICDAPDQAYTVLRSAVEGGVPLDTAIAEVNRIAEGEKFPEEKDIRKACVHGIDIFVSVEMEVRKVPLKDGRFVIREVKWTAVKWPFSMEPPMVITLYLPVPLTQYMYFRAPEEAVAPTRSFR